MAKAVNGVFDLASRSGVSIKRMCSTPYQLGLDVRRVGIERQGQCRDGLYRGNSLLRLGRCVARTHP
jgi:hypothetical protein